MKRIQIIVLVFIYGFVVFSNTGKAQEITDKERMKWWTDARFGMFIHWGIYSVPAGFYKGEAQTNSAEWIMNKGKIPLHDYEKFADQFNPTQFNAKTFVGLAKEAGMKYMVITSKHHDGFSMFDSKSNPFNVVDATPFKRDVLKELAEECAKQDIKFGFYYSQAQDWSHPGGMGNTWDKKMQRVSTDVYVKEKALPEVRQLLTEYGPIAIFWWDTPRKMSKEVIDSLYHISTDLQPAIITNDRLGDEYPGDHKTYERHLPKQKPEADYWEICQPISGSWGYRSDDQNFKPVATLLRNLADASSMGGNYLLNVSPTSLGTLAPTAVANLKAVGAWMNTNSESIYETEASPCGKPDWGYITMKAVNGKTNLYLHIFDWPTDGKLLVPIKNKAQKAYLLANSKKVFKTKSGEDGLVVNLAGKAPDPINSVVVLQLVNAPNAIPPKPFGQNEDGVVAFHTERAQFQNLQGPGARYNSSKDCIGHWTSETAVVYWNFAIDKPGKFQVTSLTAGQAETEFTVEIDGQTEKVKIPATGGYDKFEPIEIGAFEISEPGSYKITFKPIAGNWNPVNLKQVVMTPVN
ncbi:alpha-L-fucosidase [Flexithrix dorotheae]|uniref:alpha-L-fucosidase n=1 Tax=Flexithrix dorotheae TaxID=70993 RepID=UPI00036C3C73|nr:alpha-L-fucosidase [Flexithrix dorotheae]